MPEYGRDDLEYCEKDGKVKLCQGKLCSSSVQIKRSVAVKVCHHEACQDGNNGYPLQLCLKCDEVQHLGTKSTHARFDIPELCNSLSRTPSSRSNGSDSGAEEDVETENLKVDKKTRGYSSGKRMFKLSTGSKRKARRHNTDDPGRELFTLKFFGRDGDTDYEMEVVPALKGKTLKESIEPFFIARGISFATHSVFLDASNTPLPLAFDTFPLGGNVLHVKANEDVKVDQRVINMVRQIEDSKSSNTPPPEDYQRPKSGSIARSGSFSSKARGNIKKLEEDEREREAREQLKISQRGKKNIKSFLGDDPSAVEQTTPSPTATPIPYSTAPGPLHRPKSVTKLTGLFNQPKVVKGYHQEGSTLKDLLDVYTVYGMQNTDPNIKDETDESTLTLEQSWIEVVDPDITATLTKKQKDQQEAIWELLFTEVAYIHKLSIVKKLFILCLRNLQSEGFLQDIEIEKLFSNMEVIYELNCSFWTDCLSDVVQKSRRTGQPLNPMDMSEGFPMFDKRFEPYITYCMEESRCLKYFKQKLKENEDFKTYITWCEEHRLCTNRLKLTDYLVKPMQRLTKYPLLLKAIHKKTVDEGMKDSVWRMILIVESLLSKVNAAMREMYERNKLRAVAARIQDNYTVIEAVNEEMEKLLMNYSTLDLMEYIPGLDLHRCVINEGPLRLVEKQGKMDVHVFLFTDLLLITKAKKADKYRVIKPPLMVDKLYVHASKDPGTFLLIYVNEYNTVVHAFALQGTNADQSHWMDSLKKAQKLLLVAKLGQGSSMGTRLESDSSEVLSPSNLVGPGNFIRDQRRGSAASIISMESLDSDDEMGLNEGYTKRSNLPRVRSEMSLSSNSNVTIDREDEEESSSETTKYPVRKMSLGQRLNSKLSKRTASLTDLRSDSNPEIIVDTSTDEIIRKIPPVNPDVGRLRADSASAVSKVTRSSSAPTTERPKVETVSLLSRSSSEPKGPKKVTRRTSEEFFTVGLPLGPSTSVTSSSEYSTEGLCSGSECGSAPSVDASGEFANARSIDRSSIELDSSVRGSLQAESPTSEVFSSLDTSSESASSPTRPVERSASAPEKRPRELEGAVGVDESKAATFPRRSGAGVTTGSPGLRALQSLSESLEYSLKHSPSPPKQAPQIKSPLISQEQLQSAINSGTNSETPRKRTSLPRRSSPVISRKPEGLVRSKSEMSQEMMETPKVVVESHSSGESDCSSSKNILTRVNSDSQSRIPRRSNSEMSRVPIKADRKHYPVGVELAGLESKSTGHLKPQSDSSLGRSRKKSMSLSDLLSIGRELTSGRDKSENTKREDRLSSDPTDDRTKPERKLSRFRLGRSKSRNELKDGIASGPANIDKRKATKLYLQESLMLETSSKKKHSRKK